MKMRNVTIYYFLIALSAVCLFGRGPAAAADPAPASKPYQWRFPVGLGGVTAFDDVADRYEDNLRAKGYTVDKDGAFPVGISFQPYVELNTGLRLGCGIGPATFLWYGDDKDDHYRSYHSKYDDDSNDVHFYDVPVNMTIGYTFMPTADFSPYVRGGFIYHIAGGDYVEGVTPGLFGAFGIEFFRNNKVGFGVEVGYDTSRIEFERYRDNNVSIVKDFEEMDPYKVVISGYAVF